MSLSLLQFAALLFDPRVSGPPLRALRTMRARGIQRLPADVYDPASGRLRIARARRFVHAWLDGERLTRHRGQWVLNSFLPPFPGPAYQRMFDNLFSGRHLSPVSAFLAVTARCPLHCPHCSRGGRRNGPELAAAEWLDTIRQLHGLGTSLIGFTGGEPCMREDLPALVRAAAQGASTILFTSGQGFTPALAAQLRAAGLWSVCVSLDADTAEAHDAARGDGSFAVALEALRLARAQGFYTMAGMVATPAAVRAGMPNRIHRLLAGLRAHELRIVEAMPCGGLSGCASSSLLAPGDIAALRRFHVETNRARHGPKVCAFNHVESPEIFGCGAGTQHLFIEPSGVVCPCDFTPLGFGNVRDTPLADLWHRMNLAMGDNPRTHCFIQRHRDAVQARAAAGFPLPPDLSEQICREAGPEPLPAYFALVTSNTRAPTPGDAP
ncbi:MAG TPA: radical SAM protein [Kiritimatiellia bacterium]|nr:radical SAM protein [Kiritimatiellia bacterium]